MTELAREYGDGLFYLAREEHLEDELLQQLEALKGCFHDAPDFLRLLSNLSMSKDERVEIIDRSLRGQVHPYLLNFLKLLCERGSIAEFDGCEAAYRTRYNELNAVTEAVVTTPVPLKDSQRADLRKKLEALSGHRVILTERLDAALMGGLVVEMDGKRYDNTIRTRLETIRRSISGLN